MKEVENLTGLHSFLEETITSPFSFDDLLRAQIVYSVSAFDKLMHDLIRIGIVQIYTGKRVPTPKYIAEQISLQLHSELITATLPPKEFIFEQAIFNKLKLISYQDPSKISEGLSYIWDEKQKWQKIATAFGVPDKTIKTKLKLIATRRNAIVHEADIDPVSQTKLIISKTDSDTITSFLYDCGKEIYNNVK
ncbi:HEPN domain-containing protein [Shewanella scandinavica]|uniref:HEPN domain-containing protein n=1 Tax=Shewanella scandinavica TaxID=3063538 RepID=UPI00318C235D